MRALAIPVILAIVIAGGAQVAVAQSVEIPRGLVDPAYTVVSIKPSATDAKITASDYSHVVIYDRASKPGNVLLFLPGTGGRPPGPVRFLNRAVERGYRAIYLSYIDEPAVSQVCVPPNLRNDPECSREFRAKRIYAEEGNSVIPDAPQDSIVNRFSKLLKYLTVSDPRGQWGRYLEGDSPIWTHVAVAGQSQGGGMAEYIGQRQPVARVIAFSGGWDIAAPRQIAGWYSNKNATPAELWYVTYNVAEPTAALIVRTYTALGVPPAHTFALDRPVRPGREAHGEGIGNPAYRDIWDQLLGEGRP